MKGLELCSERKRVKVMLWIVALLFGGNLCIMFTSLTMDNVDTSARRYIFGNTINLWL